MEINDREKKILLLFGLVAVVFSANYVIPLLQRSYDERQESIESVQLDIERESNLIIQRSNWERRRENADERRAELEQQIFSGSTVAIIEAAIQRELSQTAREAGISVSSTRLAEQQESGGWLMISQEMAFRTDSAASTVTFLNKLKSSEPRLRVTEFSMSRTRNQYSGSITVVGFARSEGLNNTVTALR